MPFYSSRRYVFPANSDGFNDKCLHNTSARCIVLCKRATYGIIDEEDRKREAGFAIKINESDTRDMNGNTIRVEYMYIPRTSASPRISMLVRRLSFGSSDATDLAKCIFYRLRSSPACEKNKINDPLVSEMI